MNKRITFYLTLCLITISALMLFIAGGTYKNSEQRSPLQPQTPHSSQKVENKKMSETQRGEDTIIFDTDTNIEKNVEIISCPTTDDATLTPSQIELALEQHDQLYASIFSELKQSLVDEENLVGILFDKKTRANGKLNSLWAFYQKRPTHQIAYYQLLNACLTSNDRNICNQQLFDNANVADSENGMLWVSIAAIKFKQNDHQGAIDALNTAMKKSYYSEYFYESIVLFERSIRPMASQDYSNIIHSAIGYTSAISANYGRVFEHCLETGVENLDALDACFQLGQNMKENSRTLILASLGTALVKEYYVKIQNNDAAQSIEDQSILQYQQSFNEETHKATLLMAHDEDLMRLWLQLGIAQGEFSALKQITQEAKWRSQDPNYFPCKAQVVQ